MLGLPQVEKVVGFGFCSENFKGSRRKSDRRLRVWLVEIMRDCVEGLGNGYRTEFRICNG